MADNEKIALDLRNAAKAIYGFTDEELEGDDMTEPKEVEPLTVKMPTSVDEAELMQKLGYAYLKEYAPAKLAAEYEQLKADVQRFNWLINPDNLATVRWMKRPNKPMRYRVVIDGEDETGWKLSAREAIDQLRIKK